jgi:hypothetical protein
MIIQAQAKWSSGQVRWNPNILAQAYLYQKASNTYIQRNKQTTKQANDPPTDQLTNKCACVRAHARAHTHTHTHTKHVYDLSLQLKPHIHDHTN